MATTPPLPSRLTKIQPDGDDDKRSDGSQPRRLSNSARRNLPKKGTKKVTSASDHHHQYKALYLGQALD